MTRSDTDVAFLLASPNDPCFNRGVNNQGMTLRQQFESQLLSRLRHAGYSSGYSTQELREIALTAAADLYTKAELATIREAYKSAYPEGNYP